MGYDKVLTVVYRPAKSYKSRL